MHPHAAGAKDGAQDMSAQKGAQHKIAFGRGRAWYASPSYYYTRCNSRLKKAIGLIEGFDSQYLLADRGYDTDAIVKQAEGKGMESVIPSKKKQERASRIRQIFVQN